METIVVGVPMEGTSLVHRKENFPSKAMVLTLLGLGLVAASVMRLTHPESMASNAVLDVTRTAFETRPMSAVKLPSQGHGRQEVLLPAMSSLRRPELAAEDSFVQPHINPGLEFSRTSQGPALSTIIAVAASFLAGLAVSAMRKQPPQVAMFATTGQEAEAEKDLSKGGLLDLEDLDTETDSGKGTQAVPEGTEKVTGPAENYGFETNTRQILDIVARSLYHDKEVFIRELISNASDAIEKYRYLKLISDGELEQAAEPSINLYSDPVKKTFTVQDTGVGMTKEELVNNLGTIASSGSKQLMERIQAAQQDADNQLIGQFGVGFYSAFIVANTVKVYTRSCVKGSKGYMWESDGHGNYTIAEAEGVAQGTKIVVELKDEDKEFAEEFSLESIIRKYSNFIGSPIFLNGKRVNTVEALWRKNPKDVTDEQYVEFYKYITNAYDKPTFKLHYRVDAPVDIKAILFAPEYNMEQPGRNRLQPSVNLYCKKVLIKAKCPDLLPEWMRFVSGVVDSEDLPLNVSREGTQDSKAFKKLSKLVTSRVLKWLADEADKDKTKYNAFFKEFGYFLKEGSCIDDKNKTSLAKLLRFESSKLEAGQLTSFDEYIERFVEGQERIYFLHSPSRQTALTSPYYEQLRKKGVEVLFMYGTLDEYLMANYPEYKGYKFASIENSDLGLDTVKTEEEEESEVEDGAPLNEKQCTRFSKFLTKALADKCSDAKPSNRLVDSPAIIAAGFEQASMFRNLRQIAALQGKKGFDGPMGMQSIEYNPNHPIIKRMYWLTRSTDAKSQERAKMMAEQIFDNALIASGLMDDPRLMLQRLNKLLRDSLGDVEIGIDDEQDTAVDVEEEPTKKKSADPKWNPSPSEEARIQDMIDKEFDNLGEQDREKMDQMISDAMMRNTQPAESDVDVQDAEFTDTPPKEPKPTEKK